MWGRRRELVWGKKANVTTLKPFDIARYRINPRAKFARVRLKESFVMQ